MTRRKKWWIGLSLLIACSSHQPSNHPCRQRQQQRLSSTATIAPLAVPCRQWQLAFQQLSTSVVVFGTKDQIFAVHTQRPASRENPTAEETRAGHLVKHCSDLIKTHSTTLGLHSNVSLLTTTSEMGNNCSNTNHLHSKQRTTSFLFCAITAQPLTSMRTPPSTVSYSQDLLFTTNTLNVAICSEPMYKFRLSYDDNAISRCAATCLLDTGGENNIANLTLLPSQWTNRINCGKTLHLRTATPESLCM